MTREEAIKILEEIIDEGWLISDFDKCTAIDACEMAIESLEQEPRWIPVSERLPENDEVVLGTNSSNDLFETYTWDDCGELKWYANGCFDVPVIAWMPLPEPYKAESEG